MIPDHCGNHGGPIRLHPRSDHIAEACSKRSSYHTDQADLPAVYIYCPRLRYENLIYNNPNPTPRVEYLPELTNRPDRTLINQADQSFLDKTNWTALYILETPLSFSDNDFRNLSHDLPPYRTAAAVEAAENGDFINLNSSGRKLYAAHPVSMS
jgi:hypothetical protein